MCGHPPSDDRFGSATIRSVRIPEVVLMCGIAGSGKTTYAQRLEETGYIRLSIDEEIWAQFGRYGVDYPAEEYPEKSRLADATVRERLRTLVEQGHPVVVDNSFWNRTAREDYKKLVDDAGGRWRLVYLKATTEVLRRRLALRKDRFDANAAFPITEETLAGYVAAFEEPHGEGEETMLVWRMG
jgi:predicted kinase